MISTIARLVKRILAMLRLRKRRVAPGVYAPDRLERPGSVLFYLNDPSRFHLGDNFFIEPLLRLFRDNGIKVSIAPLAPMKFYYEADGFQVSDGRNMQEYDLIISRIEFYDALLPYKDKTLFLNTTDAGISGFICDYLLEEVQKLYQLEKSVPSRPFAPVLPFPSYLVDPDKKYLVYNPYLVSSSFLVREKHRRILAEEARRLANESGLEIILTGTKAERERDAAGYDFVHHDFRGKTSVEELFALSAAPNVIANVSFDAFGMHLFFLYDKPSYIVFRGRFSRQNVDFVLNSLNPPFKVSESERRKLVTYLR